MPKIRNVSGEDLYVPWGDRIVEADEVFDVPEEDGDAYLVQDQKWTAVGGPEKKKGDV